MGTVAKLRQPLAGWVSGTRTWSGVHRRTLWRIASPRSLRVQMALGASLVALGAILTVALIALLAATLSFQDYQRTQLESEIAQVATGLGQAYARSGDNTNVASSAFLSPETNKRFFVTPLADGHFGGANVWIADHTGTLVIVPTSGPSERAGALQDTAQDRVVVVAALQRALRGQSSEDGLPGSSFLSLNKRLYAAQPIRMGGTSDGQIVGAVAFSTPSPHTNRAPVFATAVSRGILLAALAVALLAAGVAMLFSRRLTQPLEQMTTAAARMAGGDYAARVAAAAPDELGNLATNFNEMAAALERDVRELQRQERLRRELIANVSHELATPLTAIQGFTEALLDGVVQEQGDREETTRLIAREAARLRRLVDQLRQVALFEGGAQALDRAPLDVPALAGETLDVLGGEIERKQITISNTIPTDLPTVYADGDRVTEILLNLLDNALRHAPQGGTVEIAGTVEGRWVRVTIGDSGPGIAPENRERIFERFYRLDASRSAATGGSGLGLAIVRSLVEAHGGTIRVEERQEGGAQFSFTLPRAG
ncbi:MAG TPA: HAMP domain-containing sensor histidine kinase [Ktedonobacterales bacterium]